MRPPDVVNGISGTAAAQAQEQEIVYRVDAEGRVTFVNDHWDAFAVANGAPELLGDAVLGRRVTDFIDGAETKIIYDLLLKRAAAGAGVTLPYRCDGPAERRRMTLTIVSQAHHAIEFRSRTVDLDPRESVRVLERHQRRDSASLLTICSWCNRGRVDDRWAEIEEVVAELRLFDEEVPQLTHGMCADCEQLVTADWLT
jgi:hypothetical protein